VFCLIAASARAFPNLAGHYMLQGDDGGVDYTVRQRGSDRVLFFAKSTRSRGADDVIQSVNEVPGQVACSTRGQATNGTKSVVSEQESLYKETKYKKRTSP